MSMIVLLSFFRAGELILVAVISGLPSECMSAHTHLNTHTYIHTHNENNNTTTTLATAKWLKHKNENVE